MPINQTEAERGKATIAIQLAPPDPLPTCPVVITDCGMPGGRIRIEYLPDATIKLSAYSNGDSSPTLSATSCPIVNSARSYFLFAASLSLPDNQMHMLADGQLIGTTNPDAKRLSRYVAPATKSADGGPFDNATATAKRADRLTGSQSISALQRGGIAYDFNELRSEREQLNDLVEIIRSGRMAHAKGLASRLRLLIAVGTKPKNLPHLQRCAAHLSEPLLVYIPRPLELPATEVLGRPTQRLSASVSHEPNGFCNTAIDIDLWLDLAAGTLGQSPLHIANC